MQLKLIVLRSGNIKQLKDFYSLLGLAFEYHSHNNSPYHYSAIIGDTVIEIYPLTKGQTEADKNLRLGFAVDNFEAVINLLGDSIIAPPQSSAFGYFAVAKDTDGRKIEIYSKL